MSGRGRARPHVRPQGRGPPQPPIIEQKLATQHMEIQRLLTENQRFAATHVSLTQELTAAQHDRLAFTQMLTEKDSRILSLESQLEHMTQEIHRLRVDAQQMNLVRAENEALRQELLRSRGGGGVGVSAKQQQGDEGKSYNTGTYPATTSTYPATTTTYPATTTTGNSYVATTAPMPSSAGTENWTTHYDPNGVPFYYNAVTGVTQWERPAALGAPQIQSHAALSALMQQLMHGYKFPSPAQTQTQQPLVSLSTPQAQLRAAYAAGATTLTGNAALPLTTQGQSLTLQAPLPPYMPPRDQGSSRLE